MADPTPRDPTQERLLEAAAVRFAERGYADVGVREICQAADANLAAVSYWFQGKEGLYRAVLERAHAEVGRISDMPRLADRPEDPEGQLRAWLAWNLRRLLEPQGAVAFSELMHHELRDPSPLFPEIVGTYMRPVLEEQGRLLAAVTGRPVSDPVLLPIAIALMGQGVIFRLARRAVEALRVVGEGEGHLAMEDMVESLLALALDGVRGLATRNDA